MSAGIANIHLENEQLLVLEDVLGMEKAREKANDTKAKSFGLLSNLLSRPNPADIEIVYEEKRYEAFWHIVGSSRFEYKRRKTYTFAVEAIVQDTEILGSTLTPSGTPKMLSIDAMDRCVESVRTEETVNAETGETGDYAAYTSRSKRVITSTDELTSDGALVVALEAKPSFLIRKVINTLIKPIQADHILEEQIGINELSLTFIPVYTFELLWKAKDKRITISFDGATGEQRPKASKISQRLRQSFSNDELFEFGKEIANFVPGGGLAMMVGKKAIELTKKD